MDNDHVLDYLDYASVFADDINQMDNYNRNSIYDNVTCDWDSDVEIDEFKEVMEIASVLTPPQKTFYRAPVDHFSTWKDNEFFTRFRMKKETVKFIVPLIEARITSENEYDGIAPEHKLLLTLRYYATGSLLAVCEDFLSLNKLSALRIIEKVSKALSILTQRFVQLPTNEDQMEELRQGFYSIAKFPRCIGVVDYTPVKLNLPPGGFSSETKPETYRNKEGYFSIKVQTISDTRLKFQNVDTQYFGGMHDSKIFSRSAINGRFYRGDFGSNVLIGNCDNDLETYFITPLQTPHTLAEQLFNDSLIETLKVAKVLHSMWKQRFPILTLGTNTPVDVPTMQRIIRATAVLHNIARDRGEPTPKPDVADENESRTDQTTGRNDKIYVLAENRDSSVHRKVFIDYFDTLFDVEIVYMNEEI